MRRGAWPVDEDTRAQLTMIAAQARAIPEALATSKAIRLDPDDHTHHELNKLLGRAHDLLGDCAAAKLLPSGVQPMSPAHGPARLDVMTAARQLATALETLLAQEPSRLEELEEQNQALEAKIREAEARAVAIVDDELRDRCVDLLLRPGKADTAVRDACVVLEHRLRRAAGLPRDVYGVDLVDQALSQKSGVLVFSDVAAEQQGIHQLYRGVIGFFKNPTSHRLIEEYDLTRARQVVGLIDTLLCSLRDARKRTD